MKRGGESWEGIKEEGGRRNARKQQPSSYPSCRTPPSPAALPSLPPSLHRGTPLLFSLPSQTTPQKSLDCKFSQCSICENVKCLSSLTCLDMVWEIQPATLFPNATRTQLKLLVWFHCLENSGDVSVGSNFVTNHKYYQHKTTHVTNNLGVSHLRTLLFNTTLPRVWNSIRAKEWKLKRK